MRTQAPALLPIFRSQAQAELLTWLYLHPGEQFTLTELANRAGTTATTMHREAGRLTEAGLVAESRIGRSRLLSANLDHPAAEALRSLLEVTFGPRQVVTEEFSELPGAVEVLIFGSWAARYAGERGSAPNDVDVLVVGDEVDRGQLYEAADRAQERLGLPVNPKLRTVAQWDEASDALSAEIRARPSIKLAL